MFLIIDNSGEEAVVFYYSNGGDFEHKEFKEEVGKGILVYLEDFLVQINCELKDVKYLGVIVGEGKFTGTRLAVTAVNTLGYALKIPVIGINKQWEPASVWKEIKKIKVSQYVTPKYSGEAHIGKKKS